jgi:hypothetical protein
MVTPRRKVFVGRTFLLAAVVLVAVGGVCQGWWPAGWPYGAWYPGWFPRSSDIERLPHYALFPPVYYSNQPVRRPYGYSPFARLPELTTVVVDSPSSVEMRSVEPLLVPNPYVTSPGPTPSPESAPARGPLIVRNPFVPGPIGVASNRQEPR